MCDESESCLFKDAGHRGCGFDEPYNGSTGRNLDVDYWNCQGPKVKDSVSSYQNRTPAWLVMWEHPR